MATFVMEAAAAWLGARQNQDGNNFRFNGSRPLTQAGTNGTTTSMLVNQFKLQGAVSVRNSTIILASFNAIAAFATASVIIFESYMRKRRNQREFPSSPSQLPFIQSTETYPFILSLGIVIQGITFAVAQAQGLTSIFARGCALIAQFMLPAVFIVPYIQLVFGLELAFRALGRKPFAEQRRWTVTGCLVLVGALLLANFLVSKFSRSPDFCFASLFWYIAKYATGCFAVLLIIVVLHLVSMMVIFLRLRSSTHIETSQRVVASRMVYFLALATLTTILMLPFFYSLGLTEQDGNNNNTLMLSMVASVAADLTGLMTGGLVLLFRSNLISTIAPKDKIGEYDRQKIKQQIRHFDPDHDNGNGGTAAPRSPKDLADLRRMLSDANLIGDDDTDDETLIADRKSYELESGPQRPNPLRSNAIYPMDSSTLRAPEATFAPKKDRKSILSTLTSATIRIAKPISLLPATVYNPQATTAKKPEKDFGALKPPPALNKFGFRHRRDSSMVSTATVQIGLRLSNFEDMIAPAAQMHDPMVHSLDCPKILPTIGLGGEVKRPSPLFAVDSSSPVTDKAQEDDEERQLGNKAKESRQSVQPRPLPPLPAPAEPPAAAVTGPMLKADTFQPQQKTRESASSGAQTLSPTTYNPNDRMGPKIMRTPSPRGVGFKIPSSMTRSASSASTTAKSPTSAVPARSPSAAPARSPSAQTVTAGSPGRSPPPRRTTGEPRLEGSDKPGRWI